MLVVGATRILRPAVIQLIAEGRTVVGLARTEAHLIDLRSELGEQFSYIAADYLDKTLLTEKMRSCSPFDSALVYAGNAPDAVVRIVSEYVTGPGVEILTSEAAAKDPDLPFSTDIIAPRLPDHWNALVLGWTADRKWHSPHRISDAAIAALRLRVSGQLGHLRPWSDRPRHTQ